MLDPRKDIKSKTFWNNIKARKQDTMNIGILKADNKTAEKLNEKTDK